MGVAAVFAVGAAGGLEDLRGGADAPTLADLGVEPDGAAGGELPIRVAGLAGDVGGERAEVHVDLSVLFVDEADGRTSEHREPSFAIEREVVAVVQEHGDLFGRRVPVGDAGDNVVRAGPLGVAGRQADLVLLIEEHAAGQAGAELVAVRRERGAFVFQAGVCVGRLCLDERRHRLGSGSGCTRKRSCNENVT